MIVVRCTCNPIFAKYIFRRTRKRDESREVPKDQCNSSTDNMSIPDFVVSRSAKTNPKNAKNAEERNRRDKRNKIDDVNEFVVARILGEECIYIAVRHNLMGLLCGGHGTQHGGRQNERGSTPFSLPGPKDIGRR
jgi:hypothetical protein